jgi:uracil-DNA glycosylase
MAEIEINKEWRGFYHENNKLSFIVKNDLDFLWKELFKDINLDNIDTVLKKEVDIYGNNYRIFPSPNLIFTSFNRCPLDNLKVVIIGQDPYHNMKENTSNILIPEAMGMSFSVPNDIKRKPPSLLNIFKEINNDLGISKDPSKSDLTSWTKQGVLLLNASLTVRDKNPGGHLRDWVKVTDKIIKKISEDKENIIFLLF